MPNSSHSLGAILRAICVKEVLYPAFFASLSLAIYLFFAWGEGEYSKYLFQISLVTGLPRTVTAQAIGVAILGGLVGVIPAWIARSQKINNDHRQGNPK
jgi:ABC-type Fe3+ transport system permease subunit